MEEKKESLLIEVGALWEGTTKAGDTKFTGKFGSAKMLMLKNNFKTKDNQPDYKLFVAPYEKKEEKVESISQVDENESVPF